MGCSSSSLCAGDDIDAVMRSARRMENTAAAPAASSLDDLVRVKLESNVMSCGILRLSQRSRAGSDMVELRKVPGVQISAASRLESLVQQCVRISVLADVVSRRQITIILRRLLHIVLTPLCAAEKPVLAIENETPNSAEHMAARAIAACLIASMRKFVGMARHWPPQLRNSVAAAIDAGVALHENPANTSTPGTPAAPTSRSLERDRGLQHNAYIRSLYFQPPFAKGGFGRVALATERASVDSPDPSGAGSGPKASNAIIMGQKRCKGVNNSDISSEPATGALRQAAATV